MIKIICTAILYGLLAVAGAAIGAAVYVAVEWVFTGGLLP